MMHGLYKPEAYKRLTVGEKNRITNGCGAGGWKIDIVPDHLAGCSIKEACNIHDFMYHVGESLEDKKEADRVFLNNMVRLVLAKKYNFFTRLVKMIRLRMAKRYYDAVKYFGGSAFWGGK